MGFIGQWFGFNGWKELSTRGSIFATIFYRIFFVVGLAVSIITYSYVSGGEDPSAIWILVVGLIWFLMFHFFNQSNFCKWFKIKRIILVTCSNLIGKVTEKIPYQLVSRGSIYFIGPSMFMKLYTIMLNSSITITFTMSDVLKE